MKLSYLAKRMIISIIIIAVISVFVSLIYYRSSAFIPFMLGAILGSAVSIWKVILLEQAVDKALTMDSSKAKNYVSLQHILRLFLSGAALLLGALVPQISLWGVATGILAYQLSIYTVKFAAKDDKKQT